MKIDLEALERKARAATTQGGWRVSKFYWLTGMLVLCDGNRGDVGIVANSCLPSDASHIAANSPPVTLALIARVRELESALDSCSEPGMDDWDEEYRDGIKAILNRGAVLP